MNTCLRILGFRVLGYALCNLRRAIILKTMYNIEGEVKEQMYVDLKRMREERHIENQSISD